MTVSLLKKIVAIVQSRNINRIVYFYRNNPKDINPKQLIKKFANIKVRNIFYVA